jgi:23S rRNA (pseudouridine1915-N3)-methyltransferase
MGLLVRPNNGRPTMALSIIAFGKLHGSYAELFAEYSKRLTPKITHRELEAPRGLTGAALKKAEAEKLLAAVPAGAWLVALDETGQDISSTEFAKKLTVWKQHKQLVFVLGGADGLHETVRTRANFLLALGRKTWPHLLCRVMLAEQIYRAQQINAGHPYHRS